MVDPNTRQGKRTPVTLKIKFKSETLEQFIERYAVDVSQGGIFIRTKEPLAVGTQMKFEFQLRDASPLIAGEGTVVWTRENDPSRPAIAPGMGVRFDRLGEGSQSVLERILAEKAKQAPQRPNNETTKPPLFTDTPTRVAPAPVQDALLGQESAAQGKPRRRPDSYNEQTPLPKPMPFHSDADEFPDEAFEEATKVRALDELIAQTAEGSSNGLPALPAAGARADAVDPRANTRAETHERESAPGLPNPPEPATRAHGRLLDTSPSPRTETAGATLQMGSNVASVPEAMARTRLGVEPAPAGVGRARVSTPPANVAIKDAPSGMRAVAAEPTMPARMPASGNSNNTAIVIISLLFVAAAGAAVWFFVLRPQEEEKNNPKPGSGSMTTGSGSAGSGSAGSGSATAMTGSGTPQGSGATPGSNANVPKADLVDTVIASAIPNSTVEIEGTDQTGAAPLTAKLEKDKAYKAKVRAPGFAALELDVKGGEKPAPAKLTPKPRVITVTSDPPGAAILLDDRATGHSTPFDVELTPAQAAKKSVRVGLRKGGYRYIEKAVDLTKLTEDDARMVGKLDEKLAVQVVVHNPNPGAGAGSNKGSAAPSDAGTGPVTSPGGSGAEPGASGSGASPGSGSPGAGSSAGSSAPSPGKGSSEPEPDFNKQP